MARVRKLKKYGLSEHRIKEIKEFCYQYPEWELKVNANRDVLKAVKYDGMPSGTGIGRPTEAISLENVELEELMKIVEDSAKEADYEIWQWILAGVTDPFNTFNRLKGRGMPCERDKYYEGRRKCYFLVSCKRR